MRKLMSSLFKAWPHPQLTDVELNILLQGTADSRYSKIKRMLAQNQLLHIRRGLYCLTEELGFDRKPHSFELAQYIYGPSYISLESALSYHQLIPERVHTTTSVASKRSKEFHTVLGMFSYQHLPSDNFYTSVELIKEDSYQFFMAKPWKAICDYIFCYKKNWMSLQPLVGSLRINLEDLPDLSDAEMQQLDAYYHNKKISRFLQGIKR